MRARILGTSVFLLAVVTGRAEASVQPPHDEASGITCNDCHVRPADLTDPGHQVLGTVTDGTSTTMIDGTQAWTADQWVGGFVQFDSGPNAGKYREITANTATSVSWSWDQPLPAPLTAGTSYKIFKIGQDDVEVQCKSCHRLGGTGSPNVGLHRYGNGKQSVGCGKCHDPHNVDPSSGVGNGLVREDVRWPTSVGTVTYPSGGPNPFLGAGYNGICETCHTETAHHPNATGILGDHTHRVEAGGTAACLSCHAHEDGFATSAPLPLVAGGVVGRVSDSWDTALTAGTVYFVPAGDVAALPDVVRPFSASATNDEPLEDLIAASGAGYQQAPVDAAGTYTLPALAAGSYFVTFVPDAGDTAHLPGGSSCREAVASTALAGGRLDLVVSTRPPASATYVGTGRCVACHADKAQSLAMTSHRLGIWSPYESGLLQDFSARLEEWQGVLVNKFQAGTTVYFYAYDGTRGMDKWKTSETDPGAGVDFSVQLGYVAGNYQVTIHNVANAADPDRTFRVDAVYGGGVLKQRYLTRVTGAGGPYYAPLPLQFQHEGQEGSAYGRTSKVWRDYNSFKWYDATTKLIKVPAPKDSFEKNCISCHAVGTRITGADATNWVATTISDPTYGDWDYNLDGVKDDMNIGCETCHGPGSAHEATGVGDIVAPRLLTPERDAMICGQCHGRPKGAFNTDSPVNAAGWMMWAGTSRANFLSSYATSQLDGAASDFYADTEQHSKSHHQQYTDLIRSGKYQNDTQLLTCQSCHDAHARDRHRQLRAPADTASSGSLCVGCHDATALTTHVDAELGAGRGAQHAAARCQDCHMVKSAKTGSGTPGLVVGATTYWQNDISSHIFDVAAKVWSQTSGQNMSTGYTRACASGCHTAP